MLAILVMCVNGCLLCLVFFEILVLVGCVSFLRIEVCGLFQWFPVIYIWCLDIFGRLPLIRFHPTVPTASSQAASQKLLGLQCLSQVSMIERDPAKANRNR